MDIAEVDFLEPPLYEFTYPHRRTELQRHLGLLDQLTRHDEEHLDPGQWLDHTTINACLRLFTGNHPRVFSFDTWTELLLGPRAYELQRFDALGLKTFDFVLWPFLKHRHFILCVIRNDKTAMILDSLGVASGIRFIGEVQNQLDATRRFKGWHVQLGLSARQENSSDCGIFCIANAAYITSGRNAPPKINAMFWRVACRTAIG
jgi:Ulp1 family protease